VENDVVIGYYEKQTDSFDVKFKLRDPIKKMKKFEDARFIQKGNTCENKIIEDIQALAEKLGINYEFLNKREICHLIKKELLTRELAERQKKPHSNIKWFYFYFEKQPIL
jgi:hypothetical protein